MGIPAVHAEDSAPGATTGTEARLAPVQILGDVTATQRLPGSAAVVGREQLEIEGTTDIHQALKTVPGVYVQEEEGFGLRPNIGIRAAPPGRSSKVTLMEDNVLIAPAPYSNPAAYYFPTTKRINEIEVLKGAPLLRHGPQTTGGVINLVSTPIPQERAGSIETVVNDRGGTDVHAMFGDRSGDWSYMIETVQRRDSGFKDIDRSNRDTGFDLQDYVGKLRWDGERQSIEAKIQYSEETSNMTYLGLTDEDFSRDPNRRYGLSEIDQMNNDHLGFALTHDIDWTDRVRMTTTLYRNEFARNWFKLSGGGDYIDAANQGDATARRILRGELDETELKYKNNNREYVSEGVQTEVGMDLGDHWLRVGARYHQDEMDRFQPVDEYDQVNGSLVYQNTIMPTGGDNRFEDAQAWSFWVADEWYVNDRLTANLLLRYEDVETSRTQYADTQRNVVDSRRSNSSSVWLPGASLTYDFTDRWQVLAGVHRGFAPLGGGATEEQDPETSTNWELGTRYQGDNAFVEAIGFYSDFSDFVQNCSVATPCSDGSTTGTFTTGEAVISGLELRASTGLDLGSFHAPLEASYTYTSAEASADNPASGQQKGDRLQGIPRHQFSLRGGLEHASGWNNYAIVKYIDETCSSDGCNQEGGAFNRTDSLTTIDLVSQYPLGRNTDLYARVSNVLDEQKIISRSPDGARPNEPRTFSVGLTHRF
ncbi:MULTISPECIES: TonB-dependent receptor domain-containing protein [unclassified Thioalkalivibrio]|uniref:TonB-dependent receptor family protein n=1 Tax=unclassified Thioalkalivibrio TaxID=2621013 RepID=UPI00056E7226|nr:MULTISPECIES: TonB-dependent receptor [unclassified Thioalkalivibrio]